jgi:hypothetical protein
MRSVLSPIGARVILALLPGLLGWDAVAGDLSGFLRANYGRIEGDRASMSTSDREQVRLYLRDQFLVKSDWTLEYGFDRTHRSPGPPASFQPRYATTLRGVGYVANAVFTPIREDSTAGGRRTDEWRASLSVSDEKYPQASLSYIRKNDLNSKDAFADSWFSSLGYQRSWWNVRAQLQSQNQEIPERGLDTRTLTGRGEASLTRNFGSWVRTAAGYDGNVGRRDEVGRQITNEGHSGVASVGVTPLRWLDWNSSGSIHWGESGRPDAMTQSHDRMIASNFVMSALEPLEVTAGYFQSRSTLGSSESMQETVSGGLFARETVAEVQYVSGQFTAGRQLESSVGPYDFLAATLEVGGEMYRFTTYRLTANAQRNVGGNDTVIPLQSTRQAVIDTEPLRNLRVSGSYSANFAGETGNGIQANTEVLNLGVTAQPRGFGSWSTSYIRSWTNGLGIDRYVTLFGSMRNARGVGVSFAYTRRTSPRPVGTRTGLSDSFQSRIEFELRDRLILSLARDESMVRKPGGQVQWQGNLRWSF